jgi:aryl-alcohol dehydrogenase-like predicted oxidoreductase
VDYTTAAAILARARENGIDTIDTAIAYGESESVLGRIGVKGLRVITKLPPIPVGTYDVGKWVVDQIDSSLSRMGIDQAYGVLLHRPCELLDTHGAQLAEALQTLKWSGRAQNVGVSIYDPGDLPQLLEACPIDLVQASFNLVDRRLATGGWIEFLRRANVQLHVRSLFLQGLLLMPPASRPAYFDRWSDLWVRWDAWRARHPDVDPVGVCIAFASTFETIDRLVVGVDSVSQLESLVAATQSSRFDFPEMDSEDEELINPALWGAR